MTIQTGINNTSNEWFKPTIDKKILKKLSKRSDFEGWKHVIIFFTSLIILGFATTMFWGSLWFVPVYILYCTLWGGADAIWHECGHRTAFKTRKLTWKLE